MTTATRTRTRRPIKRRRATPAPAPEIASYARTRAAVGLALFVVFFGFVWLLNGHWTASGSAIMAMYFRLGNAETGYAWGWAMHLIITAVELLPLFIMPFIPKDERWLLYTIWVLSVPFGIADVLTSALAIEQITSPIFLGQEWLHIFSTILAEAVGFLPERVGVPLFLLLHKVLKG